MLLSEIIAVYFENYTKQIHSVGQMQRFLSVTAGGIYSYHCALSGIEFMVQSPISATVFDIALTQRSTKLFDRILLKT
jgi:hypothetical protein